MAEAKRKPSENPEANLGLEGFDQIFDQQNQESQQVVVDATVSGAAVDPVVQMQMEKMIERFTELISMSVDQKLETAKIGSQLIDNQRQLIATQQILIRLMERSIELTRHISSLEERLPALMELPRIVESLRQRVAQLEGIEE
ncbi:MAG TPA: hypothetical protein V6C97_20235 [Oculatellaceae cyanobacterium]